MNLTSSHPFWSVNNGLPASYPSLQRGLRCDVVIIGGGITGALVAIHLVEAGLQTVVLDKREIGTGSTSGSTGLLQYEIDVPLRELAGRIGMKDACRCYQLCGESIGKLQLLTVRHRIDCGFRLRPSLYLARFKHEVPNFREEHALRRRAGFEVEFLTESRVSGRYPFRRPAALYSQIGGEVDPHRLTHGLLAAGVRQGLEVYDRTAMFRLEGTSRGVRITTDQGMVVSARRAVVACGFESTALLKSDAGSLRSTYALISEPVGRVPGWRSQCLIWESGDPYLYLRTTTEGRVIVGGEDEPFVNGSRRDALITRKAAVLLRKFKGLFGMDLENAYAWAGTFGSTKDGLPYIGPHRGYPSTWFALGYGGNGITFSLIAAELIRDEFCGRRNPHTRLFRFGR